MRKDPSEKYRGMPCSYVGVGCAYEDIIHECFNLGLPEGTKNDGYLTLEGANRFIRRFLKVRKKQYFRRKERYTLGSFLVDNTTKCCVCVRGHFLYVDGHDYWSYYDNEDDPVVCVWYLTEGS